MNLSKETLGLISLFFSVVSIAPYYYHIFKGQVRPHVFSWFLWGLLTAIGFAAQRSGGAGPGAWATGLISLACFGVAFIALFRGERHITWTDWLCLAAALSAIPLWLTTNDPLWSVLLISAIDVLGYYPTLRKSYHKPHEELVFTHLMGSVKYMFALAALEQWNLVTWFYPACIIAANFALVLLLLVRRRTLR